MSRSAADMEYAHQEYDAFHELVKLLEESGAVTRADCETERGRRRGDLSGSPASTPGLRVFAALERWGKAKAQLALWIDANPDCADETEAKRLPHG